MSVRQALVLFFALSALTFLVACGGNGSPRVVAPPGSTFGLSTLQGTYVFSTSGFDVNGGLLTMVGAFQANGSGSITGGTVDIVSSDPNYGVVPNQAISNGSYSLTSDGRGQASFTATVAAGSVQFVLDFVLASTSHGLITEFDNNGTGSGTIDLQSSSVSLSGPYVFAVSGTGPTVASSSFATVGSITLASGAVTAGVEDINNGGLASNPQIATTSTVTAAAGTAPGTAVITNSVPATYNFDVFPIDNTHFKLVETDGLLIVSGDAYTAATSLPTSSTLAFTMSGYGTGGTPLSLGGLIPLDSNSQVLSAQGVEDYNDGGNLNSNTTFGGGFTTLTGGRSTLAVTSFVNYAANDVAGNFTFAAYPFTSNGVSGVELLEIDGLGGGTSGAAFVETATSLAPSIGYGLNLSAINLGNGSGEFEEDDIAEFTTTSTSFNGIADINDQGSPSFKQAVNGSYAAGGTGRYIVTNGNLFNFNVYVVNSATFLIMETDNFQSGTGIFELQSSSGSPGAQPGIAMPPSAAHAYAARHRAK